MTPCPRCQSPHESKARFCDQCGFALQGGDATIVDEPRELPHENAPKAPPTAPTPVVRKDIRLAQPRPMQHTMGDGVDLDYVGIASPARVWAGIAAAAILLIAMGAAATWLLREDEVVVVGPAPIHAPVLVEFDPNDDDVPPAPESDEPPTADEIQAAVNEIADTAPAPVVPEPAPEGSALVTPAPTMQPAPRPTMRTVSMTAATPMTSTPMTSTPTTSTPMTSTPTTGSSGSTGAQTGGSQTSAQIGATYMSGVRRHIGNNYGRQIQGCFDQGDERHPGFSGRVGLAYMLHQDGRVASARITQNSTGDAQVGECMRRSALSWHLPPPPRRTLEVAMTFSR